MTRDRDESGAFILKAEVKHASRIQWWSRSTEGVTFMLNQKSIPESSENVTLTQPAGLAGAYWLVADNEFCEQKSEEIEITPVAEPQLSPPSEEALPGSRASATATPEVVQSTLESDQVRLGRTSLLPGRQARRNRFNQSSLLGYHLLPHSRPEGIRPARRSATCAGVNGGLKSERSSWNPRNRSAM